MISKEKPVMLASSSEKADLDRLMLIWANRFPGIPENVDLIKYEYFAAKTVFRSGCRYHQEVYLRWLSGGVFV